MSLPLSGGQASASDLAAAQQALADRTRGACAGAGRRRKVAGRTSGVARDRHRRLGVYAGKTIQALQPPFGLLVAVGVVAAFAVAIAATIAALRASGGLPTLRSTPAVGVAHQDAVTAAADLRRAIRRSLLALIIFGVVAATSWFASAQQIQRHLPSSKPTAAPYAASWMLRRFQGHS